MTTRETRPTVGLEGAPDNAASLATPPLRAGVGWRERLTLQISLDLLQALDLESPRTCPQGLLVGWLSDNPPEEVERPSIRRAVTPRNSLGRPRNWRQGRPPVGSQFRSRSGPRRTQVHSEA